jgi:hypothetical protein
MTDHLQELGRALRSIYGPVEQGGSWQHRLRTPQCPSLPRFATALEKRFTAQESQHVATCAYCKKMLIMEKPEEWQAMRTAFLAAMLIALKAVQLRRRGMAAAAVGGEVNVTEVSGDGRLESTFIEDEDRLVLEVRTKDKALEGQLVKYTIKASDGSVARTGFLLLRPDDDWYAAHAEFKNANELSDHVHGVCQLEIEPVDVWMLTGRDKEALLASVRDADPAAQAAWNAWLERAERDDIPGSEETATLVAEVKQILQA